MEKAIKTYDLRGFINDLTRTLTASLVCLDDLLMGLGNDSAEFNNAWLVNAQLERALQFFLKMRSDYLIYESSSNINYAANHISLAEELSHNFNNRLASIIINYDLIVNDIHPENIVKGVDIAIEALLKASKFIADDKLEIESFNQTIESINTRKYLQKTTKYIPLQMSKKKKRILLVEDQRELREVISKALLMRGFFVFHSENGRDAINIFTKEATQCNCCLIDMGLPDTNGIELGNYLLSQKPDLKILYISGYDSDTLKRKYEVPDNFYFIKKPCRIMAIINGLEHSK